MKIPPICCCISTKSLRGRNTGCGHRRAARCEERQLLVHRYLNASENRDELLAIPWSALTLDPNHKCFVLTLTAERVKNAPGFDKNHWPSMADATWATSIHQYYGREPYWGTGGESVRPGPDTGSATFRSARPTRPKPAA
jgi:hypothetical protein